MSARHCAVLTSFAVALQFSACTKSECPADIDLPRTWNARGFYSQRSNHSCASFFSTVQGQQTDRHASDRMKERARGFTAKVRNKLQHALNLNGNITEYEVYTPSSRRMWSRSFTLPNGMIVLSYSIRGKCAWMKLYRRGITKEIEFTRAEAPKLFGLLTRAVASEGGEPGSCWPQYLHSKRLPSRLGSGGRRQGSSGSSLESGYGSHDVRGLSYSSDDIYQWSDLPVESFTSGTDRAHGSEPESPYG